MRRSAPLNDIEPGLRLWIGTGGTATWQMAWPRRHRPRAHLHAWALPACRPRRSAAAGAADGPQRALSGRRPDRCGSAPNAVALQLQGHTLAALLDLYGKQVGVNVKSWAPQMQPQIERVFRPHLEIPLASLTVAELQMTADSYAKPKSASFGVRCLLTVLRWATAPGRAYVDRAMLDLRATSAKPTRDRVLSREELAKLLPVLQASDSIYARALLLILLTAARRGEVEAARWQDVNLTAGAWTLPVTKNGQPHIIPLSRQAAALLRGLQPAQPDQRAFVFTTSGRRPWPPGTPLRTPCKRRPAPRGGNGTICAEQPRRSWARWASRRMSWKRRSTTPTCIRRWPPFTTARATVPKSPPRCSASPTRLTASSRAGRR